MEITFPHHRELVVRQSISVKELIEKSPWLASRNELLREFERLEPNTPSNVLADLLSVGLTKYRKGIVRLLKSKKKHDLLSQIEETSQHYRTEGQRSYADDCMALAELPVLFKEKTELLLIKDENAEQPMGIKFKKNIMTMDTESFIVYAEGTEVFKCDSFFEAYTGLLACIYVMNLAYPKGLEKTLLFVQNILIGLKDNAEKNSIDKRIVNVLSLINAELKKQ
ncbi:uncharacterized protein LOC125662203 [Ostrea edulis]|uniref:uncharacterized protein LOC125662203 n=1 Tax=Ostrea edulis TaxID=37623 RepID=UPI0024AFB3FF|nr:uncharacterized protein LOC125662203 [Ostrea edulis]